MVSNALPRMACGLVSPHGLPAPTIGRIVVYSEAQMAGMSVRKRRPTPTRYPEAAAGEHWAGDMRIALDVALCHRTQICRTYRTSHMSGWCEQKSTPSARSA